MLTMMDGPKRVQRLVGVYAADGTVLGELAYFLNARLGRAHCALCDVTHGLVRPRREWVECSARLPVPFVTYHRNDQPSSVRSAAGGSLPVVAAELPDGEVIVLLDAAALDRCAGSPERLVEAVEQAVSGAGLHWPDRPPSA
jgi:hypothetical protein